jgi:hypothetical protein
MKDKKKTFIQAVIISGCILLFLATLRGKGIKSVTVPFNLDHNRMIVEAEFKGKDGNWRKARLWVDTGNPSLYLSEKCARALGTDFSTEKMNPPVPPPTAVRIGGMPLNFKGVSTRVILKPHWLFSTMHNDANLPSTVLKQYHVVFDYPRRQLTLAEPGMLKPRGVRAPASFNPHTGIIQIDAVIDGENLSLAMDNGAAFSFVSQKALEGIFRRNPNWPRITGAVGCANMWGWWPPEEQTLPVIRLPELFWGPVRLLNIGIVAVAEISPNGPDLGTWYSQKTARPVDGFLGPNAFKAFRVEIDYANKAIYFEKSGDFDSHDMDMVGLTLRPEKDNTYRVIGICKKDGKPVVNGVQPGDLLIRVGNVKTRGATMGTVVDALRGRPGDIRVLVLERNGRQIRIEAKVVRLL